MSECEIYRDKGLTGLANLGNTCFLNTALQCLSHTYEFNNYLATGDFYKYLNKKVDSVLLKEYDELRKIIWADNCKICPAKFVDIIRKIAKIKNRELFTGWAQNDLTEFLYFLFECFHEASCREITMEIKGNAENEEDELAIKCYEMMKNMYTKEYSDILRIFYGISVTISKTYNKGNLELKEQNTIAEPFLMIELPIFRKVVEGHVSRQLPNIYQCIDLHTNVTTVIDNDTIKKNLEIKYWSLPEILIISFKRFDAQLRKDNINIEFPLEDLNLSKYVCGYNKYQYVYDLYGVCNHTGNVMGGHYFAYIKNLNNKWYCFNDMMVEEINTDKIMSNTAYCLFYRKKKST